MKKPSTVEKILRQSNTYVVKLKGYSGPSVIGMCWFYRPKLTLASVLFTASPKWNDKHRVPWKKVPPALQTYIIERMPT